MTEPAGSIGEEATKLLGAVEDWLHAARERAGAAVGDLGGAVHSGPECRICPICQVIHAVSTSRPELLEHLTQAGVQLLLAARSAIDAAEQGWVSRRPATNVERIDIG